MNSCKTSIIDLPIQCKEEDQLETADYQKSLSDFIRNTDTPITIAIQGQWGSGKTSFMNGLKEVLCNQDDSPYHNIWINVWHYSLMKDPTQTLMQVIGAIIKNVTEIIEEEHKGAMIDSVKKVQDVSKKLFKGFARFAISAAASHVAPSGDASVLADTIISDDNSVTIADLRDDLEGLIRDCVQKSEESESPKRGFLLFIDDLDRVDPPVAVHILELFKNIFDLPFCVFVLAIDYDVVVKGLRPKFGELTGSNEREFRSFFDKIIQLPFQMPINTYVIDNFVKDSLIKIDFITEEEFKDEKFSEIAVDYINNSVGSNPRSLKRLFNTLSLITLIMKSRTDNDIKTTEKLITFGLVCLQISYPKIYNLVTNKPQFTVWNDEFAEKKKLAKIDSNLAEELKNYSEFNETWEQVLYRACMNDTYLTNRVFNISKLLNLFRHVTEGNDTLLGQTIESILEFSSVTQLQASEKSDISIHKSSILNDINDKLLPSLLAKLKSPYKTVEKQGTKIRTTLRYKFSKNDWEDFIELGLDVKGSSIVLRVGRDMELLKKVNRDAMIDINASENRKKLFDEIIKSYQQISKKYEKTFSCEKDPKECLITGKGPMHRLNIHYIYEVETKYELLYDSSIEILANLITEFMQAYDKVKKLQMAS